MQIEAKHHRAARILAKGGTGPEACRAAGTSPATLTRWKRAPEFQQLIDQYRDPMETAAAKAGDPDHVGEYRSVAEFEEELVLKLGGLLQKMEAVISRELEIMVGGDDPELHPREIPKWLNAFCSGLSTLQTGHDRKTGYGVVITELEKILESESS